MKNLNSVPGHADASGSGQNEHRIAHTMKVRIAFRKAANEKALCSALEAHPEFEVKTHSGGMMARSLIADDYDVLIVSLKMLKNFYEADATALCQILRRKRIILTLSRNDLLGESSVMPCIAGWFFIDGNPERIADVIRFSVEGYCLVPDKITPDFIAFRLRQPDLNSLTLIECAVLGEISLGLSNRSTSRRLGLSEGAAKLHVQSIFAKLRFQTRTEARLFGIRHRVELQELRKNLIRRQSEARYSQGELIC